MRVEGDKGSHSEQRGQERRGSRGRQEESRETGE